MALAGNGRWCYLDPKLGAMHAVAEAARKVACTGATPVAATNCLNFGNPEKPEIMAQLSAAIDGIAEACTALNIPVTGGNVSLYNETRGEGIYPTPVIGVVGILDDVTKAIPSAFQHIGDRCSSAAIHDRENKAPPPTSLAPLPIRRQRLQHSLGYAPVARHQELKPPSSKVSSSKALSRSGLIHSAKDISDGGLAVALAQGCFPHNMDGASTQQSRRSRRRPHPRRAVR